MMSDQAVDMLVAVQRGYVPAEQLAAAEQRAAAAEAERDQLIAGLTNIKVGIEQAQEQEHDPNRFTRYRVHGVLAQVYAEVSILLSEQARALLASAGGEG